MCVCGRGGHAMPNHIERDWRGLMKTRSWNILEEFAEPSMCSLQD